MDCVVEDCCGLRPAFTITVDYCGLRRRFVDIITVDYCGLLWITVDCVVEGLLWIASSIGSCRRFVWCLSCDTYACIMPLMRIASCVLPLTRALLQIHYSFTTILCLGSGQGGGCGRVMEFRDPVFASP